MKSEKDPLGALELLNIAIRVEALATQVSQESQTYRIAGRLARDPYDAAALSKAIVNDAKCEHAFTSMTPEATMYRALLQHAMYEVSMHVWEELWNDAHPNQFGLGLEGEDIALMSVWREKVRAMIKECRQGAILNITVEEYFDDLKAAGESEEDAEALADWISEIRVGGTPST
jgi:hypothetical protein